MKEKIITDKMGKLNSWLVRGLGVLGTIFFSFGFFNSLFSEEPNQKSESLLLAFLLVVFITVAFKTLYDFSGIRDLALTEEGIKSKDKTIFWGNISKIYLNKKSAVPILIIEYSVDSEELIIKTVLSSMPNEAKRICKIVKNRWNKHLTSVLSGLERGSGH